jgi:hypothetical protein
MSSKTSCLRAQRPRMHLSLGAGPAVLNKVLIPGVTMGRHGARQAGDQPKHPGNRSVQQKYSRASRCGYITTTFPNAETLHVNLLSGMAFSPLRQPTNLAPRLISRSQPSKSCTSRTSKFSWERAIQKKSHSFRPHKQAARARHKDVLALEVVNISKSPAHSTALNVVRLSYLPD